MKLRGQTNMKLNEAMKEMEDAKYIKMKEWNDKIECLMKYIKKEFPNGCSHVSGEECCMCILCDSEEDTLEDVLCGMIQKIK